jgi:hypothetical protein
VRFGVLAKPSARQNDLRQCNHDQAINANKVAVAAYQCRIQCKRGRGYPKVIFIQGEAALLPGKL